MYIEYSVNMLEDKDIQVVGSNAMFFMFPYDNWKMCAIQCGMKRQIHESCLSMKLSHWRRMGGYANNNRGEGSKLFDGVNHESIKVIDIRLLMCCIAHKSNTIPKDQFNQEDTSLNMNFDLKEPKLIISEILKIKL